MRRRYKHGVYHWHRRKIFRWVFLFVTFVTLLCYLWMADYAGMIDISFMDYEHDRSANCGSKSTDQNN